MHPRERARLLVGLRGSHSVLQLNAFQPRLRQAVKRYRPGMLNRVATASRDAPRHRKGHDIHRPGKPVLFEAGNRWRRIRWVGAGSNSDSDHVRCDGKLVVNVRTALGAEVLGAPLAVAGAIRDRLPALDGELPRR
jgi:hypothetical protein